MTKTQKTPTLRKLALESRGLGNFKKKQESNKIKKWHRYAILEIRIHNNTMDGEVLQTSFLNCDIDLLSGGQHRSYEYCC